MTRINPVGGQVLSHALAGLLIGVHSFWWVLLPHRWGIGWMALCGSTLSALGATVWAWFRYRDTHVEFDDGEIRLFRSGTPVWGGKWSQLHIESRGLRRYLIDDMNRHLHVAEIVNSFRPNDQLILKLRSIAVRSTRRKPEPLLAVVSVLVMSIGILLMILFLPPLTSRLSENEFVIDRVSAPLIFATAIGVIVSLFGTVATALVFLGYASAGKGTSSDHWLPTAPVEMEPGHRYRFRNRDKLRKDSPPGWVLFALLLPFAGGAVYAGFAPPPPGSEPMPPVVGILIAAVILTFGVILCRLFDQKRACWLDEFEVSRNNELRVFRGSEIRTLTLVPSKPKSFTRDSRFMFWSESYRDSSGKYLLDRRYLEPV